jgi:phospholipid transport system transporter-binding protein
MSGAWIVPGGHARLDVEGVLDFDTVMPLVDESRRYFAGEHRRLEVDLRGVCRANSAGLALLLEWLELAQERGISLRFRNLPESLARLASITNLTGLLPVIEGGA